MLIFTSPGQGSQKPGILEPWISDPVAFDQLKSLDRIVDFDLIEAGTSWDSERLRDTRIAQPLIFAASIVCAQSALQAGAKPTAVAGHSIGEWAASVIAGVLSVTDAMTLVTARADAMALACNNAATGLVAVLGGDRTEVLETVNAHGLELANDNGPGQLVVGGSADRLAEFSANPPGRARIRALAVAGGFHTEAMRPAVAAVRSAAARITPTAATIPLISNRDGEQVTDRDEILNRMIDQIALPVRWDLVMDTIAGNGAAATIETCPAGTLSAILRRRIPTLATHPLNSPADIEALTQSNLLNFDLAEVHQ